MKNLINAELLKLFRSKVTIICMSLLFIIMGVLIIGEYSDVKEYNSNKDYHNEVISWKEREENLVKYAKDSYQNDNWLTPLQKDQIQRRIEIAEYRLDNNIEKDIYKNVWWFFNDNSFSIVCSVIVVMIVLIGAVSIAGEYSSRTIRQVLLLPYRREKILSAKLIALLGISLFLFAEMFLMGLISGFVIHGTQGLSSLVVLYFGSRLTVMNMSVYSIIVVLFQLIKILFYISLVVFISVATKNVSATVIISAFIAVFSGPISFFLGSYYKSLYYLPFANLDFRRYLDFGTTMPEIETYTKSVVVSGLTSSGSAIIVILSIIILVAGGFAIFRKQDL